MNPLALVVRPRYVSILYFIWFEKRSMCRKVIAPVLGNMVSIATENTCSLICHGKFHALTNTEPKLFCRCFYIGRGPYQCKAIDFVLPNCGNLS